MRNYPIPRLAGDERMSDRLIGEVRVVLLRHGYPELTRVDTVTLRVALVRFVYGWRTSTDNPAAVDLNVMAPPDESPMQPTPSDEELAESVDDWYGGFHLTEMVEAQRGMTEAEVERFLATGEIPDFSRPPVVDYQSDRPGT